MYYDKIDRQEVDRMERVDGITPNYTYEDYVMVKNEDGEIVEEYYINLTIHKTADEVYQESLNPRPPVPDENTIWEERIALQEEMTLDIDYRVTCIELGI